jgi:hypothetical protein
MTRVLLLEYEYIDWTFEPVDISRKVTFVNRKSGKKNDDPVVLIKIIAQFSLYIVLMSILYRTGEVLISVRWHRIEFTLEVLLEFRSDC